MMRFPQFALAVAGLFIAVLMSLAFCGNLHINMAMPGSSEPFGCSMSVQDHDSLVLNLSGAPGSSLLILIATFAAVVALAAFSPAGSLTPLPSLVLRTHPVRRDRWLEYLRRGLLNPKSF